ncbi:MAG: (2Fe-2S)-binding protein [Candidatus Melainabacteria bacterium]|nr:MAG: (2Fe-2S)-binding protein [Candidatus Melainabacteria bacterium]
MTNCNGQGEEVKILPDWKKVLVSREEFLKALGFGLSGVIALFATIPGVAFILNYLFVPKDPKWVNVGVIEKFKQGETALVGFHDPYILPWDGVSGHRSAWVRRNSDEDFTAFAVNCTHLGCPVRWKSDAQLFMCPCHGGVYYKDGEVAGGPPPRPLHRYPVRLVKGDVQIQVGMVLEES